jgi:hypothetical protein
LIRQLVFLALAASVAAPAPAQTKLSASDQANAFRSAGFKLVKGRWQACGDPGTESYTPGTIESVRDLNGDKLPEAVITEGSTFCFGGTETGYSLVSKQANGTWKLMTSGPGIATFLAAKGVAGWPDIEVGGPGFCFPVERWNGREYRLHSYQYDGKPCRPSR